MAGINTIVTAVQKSLELVAGIGSIYTYRPIGPITPDEFPYAIITDLHQSEQREGMPYRAGTKWIHHTIMVEVHNESITPENDQAAWYDFLDSIRTQLRDDPSLGGVTLRFGESIDVQIEINASVSVVIYDATITSEALEQITG